MTPKDSELIAQLLQKTKDGTLTWEDSALPNQFVAAVGGKVTFVLDDRGITTTLTMRDFLDRDLVHLEGDPRIGELFDIARRRALRVDETLDEVIQSLRAMK